MFHFLKEWITLKRSTKQEDSSPSISGLLAEKPDIWRYSVASEYTIYFNLHLSEVSLEEGLFLQ